MSTVSVRMFAISLDDTALSFEAHVAGIPIKLTLDTLASQNFISESFARQHHISFTPRDKVKVTLGVGREVSMLGQVTLHTKLGPYNHKVVFNVLSLAPGIDAVLGLEWLNQHNVVIDFALKSCRINKGLRFMTLNAIQRPSENPIAPLLSSLQLYKAIKKDATAFFVQLRTLEKELADGEEWSKQKEETMPGIPPQMSTLLNESSDVFPEELPAGLPPDRGTDHTIPLEPGAKPVFKPMYRLSPLEVKEVKAQITEYLSKGWITPSSSPYGQPILFVSKKGGSLRMCIDFRALNKQFVKTRYALPRIDDPLDQFNGAKVFTALDLAQGYHQIRMTPEDCPKTAFRTPMGHYEFKVLPFGLTNALATFQARMNDIIRPYFGRFVLVYLDDILIYSKNEEEHIEHVRQALSIMRKYKFYAEKKKCMFMQEKLLYLGHEVGPDGIRPDAQKLSVVPDWPEPRDVKEVRSFLGLANYFSKLIYGFAEIAKPMTNLAKASTHFEWTPECKKSFDRLKWCLTHLPTLALFDPELPCEVVTDASMHSLGGVLFQGSRAIAYESRTMNLAEQRYSVGEQKLLATVHCLRKWRCYLEGAHSFVVVTDHNLNVFLNTKIELSRWQARWSELLQSFDFRWEYRPGRTNLADSLSRIDRLVPLPPSVATTLEPR